MSEKPSNNPIFKSENHLTKNWGKLGLWAGFIALGGISIGALAIILTAGFAFMLGMFLVIPMVIIPFFASLAGIVMSIIGARTARSSKNTANAGIILNAVLLLALLIFGGPFLSLGLLSLPSPENNYLYGMDFSPDGKFLATGWTSGEIRVLDTATGKRIQTLKGHTADVIFITYSPDGKILASASRDQTIRIWDTATNQELYSIPMEGIFQALSFSPDGNTLMVATRGSNITLLTTTTYTKLKTIPQTGNQVIFSPDGAFVGFNRNSNIYLLNTKDFSQPATLTSSNIDQFSFSPNIELVAVSLQDLDKEMPGDLQVWNLSNKKIIYSKKLDYSSEQVLNGYSVTLAFSPDSEKLAYTAGNYFNLLDIKTEEIVSFETSNESHRFRVSDIAFSPDASRVAVNITDYVLLWDVKSRKLLWQFP